MSARAAYLKHLKREWPNRDATEYDERGFYGMPLMGELDAAFPEMKEVCILHPMGRTDATHVVFSPTLDSPYVFETFVGGASFVHVYLKSASFFPLRREARLLNDWCALCLTVVWNRGERGTIDRSYVAHPVPLALLGNSDWVRAALPRYPNPSSYPETAQPSLCVLL